MLYLLFSHRFPSHASLQTHEKLSPSPAFKQVAPFWQGSDEQGLGARQKGKQYNTNYYARVLPLLKNTLSKRQF